MAKKKFTYVEILLIVYGIVLLILIRAAIPKESDLRSLDVQSIRATHIQIVDENGNKVAELGGLEGDGYLRIMDASGCFVNSSGRSLSIIDKDMKVRWSAWDGLNVKPVKPQ